MTECYLMDIERTLQSGTPCFWKRNRHGYTYKIEFAGIFPKEVAEAIVDKCKDNTTVSIPLNVVQNILGKDLKRHEGF